MSERRRRAENFTDSLNSFRDTTDSETDVENIGPDPFSHDSLEETSLSSRSNGAYLRENKIALHSIDTTRSSKHSTILAGSSTKDSIVHDASNYSTILRSANGSKPDLNKRIDLFHNDAASEQLKCNPDSSHPCFSKKCRTTDNKENKDPQYSLREIQAVQNYQVYTNEFIEDIVILSENVVRQKVERSTVNRLSTGDTKRDTNYNIQQALSNTSLPKKQEKERPKAACFNASPTTAPSLTSNIIGQASTEEDIHKVDYETVEDNKDVNKFESLLCSLDNQLNQMKEVSQPQRILRRLSDKFLDSPKNFTEKLLTIIEESIQNNDDHDHSATAVSLSRLTTEFKKMCKFIEDESIIDWPPSPVSIPPYTGQLNSASSNNHSKAYECKKDNTTAISSVSSTPISAVDRVKNSRRLFHKTLKNTLNLSVDDITNFTINEHSDASFESLEAQCKKLYQDEQESIQHKRRSLSLPSLMSMSDIQIICEKQMASLNVSDNIHIKIEQRSITPSPNSTSKYSSITPPVNKSKKLQYLQLEEFSSSKLQQELHHKLEDLKHSNASCAKRKLRNLDVESDSGYSIMDKLTNNYKTVNPDELEKTLLQDIAEKRKRCLDTAKLLMEINVDTEGTEAQKTLHTSPALDDDDDKSSSLCNNEMKFLNTLISCKKYHTYLTKQKPLLDLCRNSESSASEVFADESDLMYNRSKKAEKVTPSSKKSPSVRNVSKNYLSPRMNSYNTYKSPTSKKWGKVNNENSATLKPKLFVTPGKSPKNYNNKRKQVLFPSMDNALKRTEENILKSPHAAGLYRLNYNTIMSPVGMYIRGTDMQLIKNVRAKTDRLLLTPTKTEAKKSPSSAGQSASLKTINKTPGKLSLKVNLSPKLYTTPNSQPSCTSKGKEINTPTRIENIPDNNFKLPKVSYKLPLQVRTIKDAERGKTGNRVKQLVSTAQNRVVIRHEGRVNSMQRNKEAMGNREIYEINYKPEDESIHVEQAASKTNFIRRRKDM